MVLLGLVVGAVSAEALLRVLFPNSMFSAGHRMTFTGQTAQNFRLDAEVGFLPVLGTQFYSQYGCRPNDYDALDPKGRQRLLFIGDSVTYRSTIVDALQELYGDQHYEYWNAGVESFNTTQELALYRRHNRSIHPHHVILTFHNNDYQETPAAIREGNRVSYYTPAGNRGRISPWLMQHSYLYRFLLGISFGNSNHERRAREVHEQLRAFHEELQQDKIQFSVLLLPIMRDPKDWSYRQRWSRDKALETFQQLSLRHFDLLPPLTEGLQERLEVQEMPGDDWHPSRAISRKFANYLFQQRLLDLKKGASHG